MNFKISRYHLFSALMKVQKAVSSKTPLPVLTGIKFELSLHALILTGSDSDITIQTRILADPEILVIKEAGSIVLSAKYIIEIIRKIDSDFVEFELIDGTLTRIIGDKADFSLNGIKATDYPKIDLSKVGEAFVLDAYTLKSIISKTIFATSDKETRPILTGVNFKAIEESLECTATDSYRLAKTKIPLNLNMTFNITIPSKSLNELSKLIDTDEKIELFVSDRKMLIIFEHFILQTRLIDGSFPDTTRLIPNDFNHILNIESKDLLNAIDRASLISSDGNHIINLSLSEERLVLTSKSSEIGSVTEEMNGIYKGPGLSISFSSKFVNDAIKAINNASIEILFTGDMKPFILRNPNDLSTTQLVLPVRTY